jgi:hypothetical protein
LDFALLKISMCRWDMFSLLDCEKLSDAFIVCVFKLLCLSLVEILVVFVHSRSGGVCD